MTTNLNALLTPTIDNVTKYLKGFDKENDLYEKTINKIIGIFPHNTNYEEILTKVILINKIYNTNIFNVYLLANSIKELNIDGGLVDGDMNIVSKIDRSYYKIDKNGERKYISCYSFATKYCSFHNNAFPIYDSIIADMLYLYNKKDNFSKFTKDGLRNYDKFIGVLNDFTSFYGLTGLDYKNLDKFLWQYGKLFIYNNYQ